MNATKFTFDTVFSDDRNADAARRQTFSEAEVAQLCEEARVAGMKAGEVTALEAIAAGTHRAADAVKIALGQMALERQSLLEESSKLAFAIARKLAHAALTEFPLAEVEAALREAMHQATGEPRLVLKAAPSVSEALAPRMAEIAHEEGFDGKLQVSGDPALSRADCRIEWRGGGAERAEAAIESALEELIARNFRDGDDRGVDHGQQ